MSVYIGCHISINCQSAVSLDISAQRIGRPAYYQIHISINCHFRLDSRIAVCHMDAFGTGCACHTGDIGWKRRAKPAFLSIAAIGHRQQAAYIAKTGEQIY